MPKGGNRVDQTISPTSDRIMPIPFSGCWIWLGKLDRSGYGRIVSGGKEGFAHRFSWRQHRGNPGNLHVLHKCDVPSCINPDHLFLGTQAANVADMHAKGRHGQKKGGETRKALGYNRGEKCATSKLTDAEAAEILASPGIHREIAARYGVSRELVGRIKRGSVRRHLREGCA